MLSLIVRVKNFLFILLVALVFSVPLRAVGQGSGPMLPDDTSKIATYRINQRFNDAYVQTLRPSFFGQELFQPVKTMLVGDITANFVMFNSPKSRFFFDVEARVKLRLLQGQGAPVKSPSYMPGGYLYYRVNHDADNPKFLMLSYTHHSNGVRGPTLLPDGGFNRDSGKFSTNFYQLVYTKGKRTEDAAKVINRYANIGLEVHAGLFGLGVAEGLTDHYGFVRVNGGYVYNIARKYADPLQPGRQLTHNWQRLALDFTYIADKYNGYSALDLGKRFNINLKYYYQFPFMQNVSFVVGGGYRGQDEYNIFFQDSYAYAQFGLASGLTFLYHKR